MTNGDDVSGFAKILFRLKQDEDGYPPVQWESLWGVEVGAHRYRVDNVPLYAVGVSKFDIVEATPAGEELIATRVVARGGHSTLNVFVEDGTERRRVVERLKLLGAAVMMPSTGSLFSVDIPPEAGFDPIDTYLESISDGNHIAYGDLCLQHPTCDRLRVQELSASATVPFLPLHMH